MNESFSHIQSYEKNTLVEAEEFDVRFAKFINDPISYLAEARSSYLDEHMDDTSELVSDVVEELTGYLEHADYSFPQLEEFSHFKLLLRAHDSEDYDLAAKYLFCILKEAGFTRTEVEAYIAFVPDAESAEEALKIKGERVIFNEVYGME